MQNESKTTHWACACGYLNKGVVCTKCGGSLPAHKTFLYRKKPVVIEAFKFYGPFLADDIPQWFTDAVHRNDIILRGDWKCDFCEIKTLEGMMKAQKGDWIIKGVRGEMYPCKPDIFEATYERV